LKALRSHPVEPGYHLCYGMPNDEHVVTPTDLANKVETTNGILARLERSLQYVRVPAPKHRDDGAESETPRSRGVRLASWRVCRMELQPSSEP